MGATAWMMEAWVERTMQVVKRAVKYMISAHPEKLFVNRELLEVGLRRTRLVHLTAARLPSSSLNTTRLPRQPNATTPASL